MLLAVESHILTAGRGERDVLPLLLKISAIYDYVLVPSHYTKKAVGLNDPRDCLYEQAACLNLFDMADNS